MGTNNFTKGVSDLLKWYVYRLIDPRNGETFYIGKGRGNRVFAHAQGVPDSGVEVSKPVLQRIKEIQLAGLEVSHVIHRHGIAVEWVAYEVEAALIDAYPGALNQVAGHGSDKYGCRHADEIVGEFEAEEFDIEEPLMLISIPNRYFTHSTYDAVRTAWKVSINKARQYDLVLAHVRGLVVGAFRPHQPWIEATKENFPGLLDDAMPGRRGFIGEVADDEVCSKYVGKRVPARYRRKGAANPVRFCDPDK